MRRIYGYLILGIPIVLLILGYIFPSAFFSSQERVRGFVASFGILAPLLFICLHIIQIVIPPINHHVIAMAGGFIFGFYYGWLLNFIGYVTGSSIAYFIAKRYGRPLARKVIGKEDLEKFERFFKKAPTALLALFGFVPMSPHDEFCYALGASGMSYRRFLVITIPVQIVATWFLSYLGSGMKFSLGGWILIFIGGSFIALMFYLFWRKYNKRK